MVVLPDAGHAGLDRAGGPHGCHRCRERIVAGDAGALFSGGGGVDIAGCIDGERGDFFLGGAVENEGFAGGRDAIDEAAAVGAGDEVAFGIEGQNANVDFVALEEKRSAGRWR